LKINTNYPDRNPHFAGW